MLVYINDTLAIHHDAETALRQLDKYFAMKLGPIGDPDIYFGARLREVRMSNEINCWSMSPSKYVQDAVQNMEQYLMSRSECKLSKRATSPWPMGYVAELDATPELDLEQAKYYQSQIGVLHWMVEIGHVDIITEVPILASYLALPHEGHLDAIFHIFVYLKKRHN